MTVCVGDKIAHFFDDLGSDPENVTAGWAAGVVTSADSQTNSAHVYYRSDGLNVSHKLFDAEYGEDKAWVFIKRELVPI